MIELFFEYNCHLGEGPMVHPETHLLYWVDILDKKLHALDLSTKEHNLFSFEYMPGAVVPVHDSKKLLISFENGLAYFDPESQNLTYIKHFHENRPDLRANDGKCDPFGNFWVGTMSKTCQNAAGALYKFDTHGELHLIINNTTISNGLAWDLHKPCMYFIDSMTDAISSYDILDYSFIGNSVYHPEFRYFDGMTIDEEGMLWVAHCTLGKIVRWNPENQSILEEYTLPAPKCTSLCFHHETLYITTAREHMSPTELEKYPLSGSIFKLKTQTKGFKTLIFKPNL